MKGKTALVLGSHLGFSSAAASVIEQLKDKGIEVVVHDGVDNFGEKEPSYLETEKFIDHFTKTRMEIPEIYGSKQFKCKGKHQYRENNGQWICECGRKIND